MTTSQKAALSLLISVLLFGAFAALAFTSLFDLIEARFYNPSITSSIIRENTRSAEVVDSFIEEMRERFSDTLKNPAIRRSFLPNQSAEDIFERSRIYGLYIESINGFQWVRFIDSGGSRIHFSTYGIDLMRQDGTSVAYNNYNEPGFPYEEIAAGDKESLKLIFDERGDRILFAFPFYDSFDVYRGTALFSLSSQAMQDRLIRERMIKVGQDISVISSPQGLLSGMSVAGETAMPSQVSAIWKEGLQRTARLVSPNSGLSLALVSVKTAQGLFFGRLVNEDLFVFPITLKIILLASFFFTVYLTIFLFFNLRQDSVTIVQNRLKQLQISLIEQFYERKGDMDWARWSRELEQRRDEINVRLKQGVRSVSANKSEDIDVLIDKSWDELMSVMGGRTQLSGRDAAIDEEKLQTILNRILAALPGTAISGQVSGQSAPVTKAPVVSAVTEAAPLSATDAEEVEDLEELGELDELDEELDEEAAELAEEVEEIESVEEIEEVESAEEIEEIEEIEEAESAEEIEEIEEVEETELAEEIEEVESAEEIEEIEEIEELAEVEAFEEAPPEAAIPGMVEEIIPAEAAEKVEALEELEEIEEAAEPFELNDIPELEEMENMVAATVGREKPPDSEIGVPIIDVEEMNLSSAMADEVLQSMMSSDDEIEELEELGDSSSLETLEEAEPADEAEPAEKHPAPLSAMEIKEMASKIEFGTDIITEVTEEVTIGDDLEIVSPFSTMLMDFSAPGVEAAAKEETSGEPPVSLEEELLSPDEDEYENDEGKAHLDNLGNLQDGNASAVQSLPYEHFLGMTGDKDIEILEAYPDGDDDTDSENSGVIEEREGVHYVTEDVLSPDPKTAATLDRNFKKLVDSVVKL